MPKEETTEVTLFSKVANSLERAGCSVCPLVILVTCFSIPFDISWYLLLLFTLCWCQTCLCRVVWCVFPLLCLTLPSGSFWLPRLRSTLLWAPLQSLLVEAPHKDEVQAVHAGWHPSTPLFALPSSAMCLTWRWYLSWKSPMGCLFSHRISVQAVCVCTPLAFQHQLMCIPWCF